MLSLVLFCLFVGVMHSILFNSTGYRMAEIVGENLFSLIVYAAITFVIVWLIVKIYYSALLRTLKTLRKRENELQEIKTRLSKLEYRTNDITDSLNYARRIQEALLPSESFLKGYFNDFFIFFQPRDIVSGDFYWFGSNGGKQTIVVGDCTGHGVPGALLSMLGYNLLNQIIKEEQTTRPGDILNRLDDLFGTLFTGDNKDKRFLKDGIDIGVCSIDEKNRVFEFSGAFNSLYVVSDGKLSEIKGDKIFLGTRKENQSYTTHVSEFGDGCIIYLFTDGYADQFGGEENKKFMYRRLRYLLTTIHDLPMKEQKIILSDTIRSWMGNNLQIDDILVIGIRL